MRLITLSSILFASTLGAACGDDPVPQPDNRGFVVPDAVTLAHTSSTDPGSAPDWSCLRTPTDDTATTVAITLTGEARDFQRASEKIRDATVTAFRGIDYQNPVATSELTGSDGIYSVTLPAGVVRVGFKVAAPNYMDTFLLNQLFDPGQAEQTLNISAISTGLATALPALIGERREEGTGVLAGAIRDCAGNEVSQAIATVSSAAGSARHLEGAQTYYLDAGANLPVRHEELVHTDKNGLFAVFHLPPTATAYIQVWGFVDAAGLAQGEAGLTLLAELPSPVVGDSVITGSIEPLRTGT
jgi:hypothetical protein